MGNKSSKLNATKSQQGNNSVSADSTFHPNKKKQQKKTRPLSLSSSESQNTANIDQDINYGYINKPERDPEIENITKPKSGVKSVIRPPRPARELERCKRCDVVYFPAHIDNPYVNTVCGRHHPGHITTRERVLERKGPGLVSTHNRAYLGQRVWDCCLLPVTYTKQGLVTQRGNGCAVYKGNHEPKR